MVAPSTLAEGRRKPAMLLLLCRRCTSEFFREEELVWRCECRPAPSELMLVRLEMTESAEPVEPLRATMPREEAVWKAVEWPTRPMRPSTGTLKTWKRASRIPKLERARSCNTPAHSEVMATLCFHSVAYHELIQ